MTLTYEELQFPNYTNTNAAIKLKAQVGNKTKMLNFTVADIAIALELAGLNSLWISDTGRGKTQLMSDIAQHHFGGSGKEGSANWADGRPSFDIQDLFERTQVDLESGKFDSDTARQVKEERLARPFNGVDEINRAPGPRQNEFFDLADGKYTFNGQRKTLGKDGYGIFMATANLNKLNGDFSGTFELDRALLNRAHMTLDLDHKDFRPTAEDEMRIEEKKANPKVDIAEPQDLSDKIIAAHQQIKTKATTFNPYFTAFRFLVGRGLDYCDTDKYKEKSLFPMLCDECEFTGKDLCSRIKGSSQRTLPAVKTFAYALNYLEKLKEGREVEIDTLDAALQAFKLTTYHGNLNELMATEDYAARKQTMMDETVDKLTSAVDVLRPYFPLMFADREPIVLTFTKDGQEYRAAKEDAVEKALKKNKVPFQEIDVRTELKAKGIGTDWVDAYQRRVAGYEPQS